MTLNCTNGKELFLRTRIVTRYRGIEYGEITYMLNVPLLNWLLQLRSIDWKLMLGFETDAIAWGSYRISPSRLNSLGEFWGHTYIKAVGDHYEDYSLGRVAGKKLAGTLLIPASSTAVIFRQEFKTAAPNVTGLIGEVLVPAFFQTVLKVGNDRLAHVGEGGTKSPDYCTAVTAQDWARLLITSIRDGKADSVALSYAATLAGQNWGALPLPVEIKTRLTGTQSPLSSAFKQLQAFWSAYPATGGVGHYVEVDLPRTDVDNTTLKIHLFALNSGQNSTAVANQIQSRGDYTRIKAYLKAGVLLGTP